MTETKLEPSPLKRIREKIEFLAYLPPIQSAIMKSGDGDLMQVKLNVNLLISPDAAKLMLMTNKRLKIIVQEIPEKIIRDVQKRKTANPIYNKADE